MKKALCTVLVAIMIFSMMPSGAMGQPGRAIVVGVVRSAQGNPVSGVKILARNSSAGVNSEGTTDVQGQYALQNLTPGRYQLALDPVKSPFKGQTVVSAIGAEGLTVDWIVSETAEAFAAATPGTRPPSGTTTSSATGGLFGFGPEATGALIFLGGSGLISGIMAGAGAFSGGVTSGSQ